MSKILDDLRRAAAGACMAAALIQLSGVVRADPPPPASATTPPPTAAAAPAPAQTPSPLPTLNVRLSSNRYRIRIDPRTGAPVMPKDIVAYASLWGWPTGVPQPSTFTWHVYLDWDYTLFPTHHDISLKRFQHASPFAVNLDGQIRGGRLKVIAKTVLEGREIVGYALADVVGENPPRATVLQAFPVNRVGQIASKIAMAESGMQQFNAADGLPMISRTNDLGMMQLNVPTGSVSSADQVWDWRANLRRGLDVLDDKRRTMVLASRGAPASVPDIRGVGAGYGEAACINVVRWYLGLPPCPPPAIPPLSPQSGSGMRPGEPDPDKVALTQQERDAIRRYNGGHEYALALITDPETLTIHHAEWQIDPARGGVRARSGDPDYITHVLLARSGFVYPRPAAKPVRHRARRRHHR